MRSFSDAFRRKPDGSWECVEPATLQGPSIRIEATPGDIYTPGTDLAEFLNVEAALRAQTAATINRLRR